MNHSRRRVATIGGLALATALALPACSGSGGRSGETDSADGGELTPVKLQLQWLPQGQFAGYFAAVDQGYFEEEGLDVEIIPSGGDIVPQDALANGDVDYAIAWVPKVLGSIEQGAEPHRHRADLPAVGHAAGLVGRLRHRLGRRLRGQEDRLVGLRQRVGDLRGDGRRGPRRHDRADHHAGLQHERLPAG